MLFLAAFEAIISTMGFVGKLLFFFFLTLLQLAQLSPDVHWSVSQDLQSFDFSTLAITFFLRDRAFIFGICVPCDKTFPTVPKILNM